MAKIVIVGAGHNALVAACYLAKAGHSVEIFEKRSLVGGCCVTDETTFPGFKVSSAAYVNSLFLPEIVEDFNLRKYGYEVLFRNPSSFTPLPNGKYLLLGPDKEYNQKEIAKFSEKDAIKYPEYEIALDRIAQFLNHTITMTPPNLLPRSVEDFKKWLKLSFEFTKMGPVSWARLTRLMFGDAVKFLDSWFESDVLKATLLTDATIGATNLSGYVLLHHVMGEAGGTRGVWGYQRGGMGGLSNSLKQAAEDMGVKIHVKDFVRNIVIKNGQAVGVSTRVYKFVEADIVVSGVDPKLTFLKLIQSDVLSKKFRTQIKNLDFSSASMKINLALNELPSFFCLPGTEVGPQHQGTIHLSPSVEYILHAMRDGSVGVASDKPILELTLPTAVDDSLAPKGKHLMNIFCQFTPYKLRRGSWESSKWNYFFKNVVPVLGKYIENIDNIILGAEVLSPRDLEEKFSLTEGNIFHGSMGLNQLFLKRPLRGYANYRTPIKHLYMCGAGTHPGGGVIGANGSNAAREIINDLKSQ